MRSATSRFGSKLSPTITTTSQCIPHQRRNTAIISKSASTKFNNTTNYCSHLAGSCRFYSQSTRLAEVGKFQSKQPDENYYPPGQPFLHRIFGYRGVTLFPWLARVEDNDLRHQDIDEADDASTPKPSESTTTSDPLHLHTPINIIDQREQAGDEHMISSGNMRTQKDVKHITRLHPYYQVLIDSRDCPYVSNRTQTEAVTFLGHPDNSKSVYSIKGLDYVAHEDILPYTSYEETPIHHELHNKLFKFDANLTGPSKFKPSDLLDSWRNKHPWLELSRVYRKTTENVRVTVIPFYLGHTTIEEISFHWWRYCVRLENFSDTSVQLRERHWKIFSQTNMIQTIKGRGVVGVEPLLTKHEPAYQYSSHVNLQDKSGLMWGTFKMQKENGYTFECKIPSFSLESSQSVNSMSPSPSKPSKPVENNE